MEPPKDPYYPSEWTQYHNNWVEILNYRLEWPVIDRIIDRCVHFYVGCIVPLLAMLSFADFINTDQFLVFWRSGLLLSLIVCLFWYQSRAHFKQSRPRCIINSDHQSLKATLQGLAGWNGTFIIFLPLAFTLFFFYLTEKFPVVDFCAKIFLPHALLSLHLPSRLWILSYCMRFVASSCGPDGAIKHLFNILQKVVFVGLLCLYFHEPNDASRAISFEDFLILSSGILPLLLFWLFAGHSQFFPILFLGAISSISIILALEEHQIDFDHFNVFSLLIIGISIVVNIASSIFSSPHPSSSVKTYTYSVLFWLMISFILINFCWTQPCYYLSLLVGSILLLPPFVFLQNDSQDLNHLLRHKLLENLITLYCEKPSNNND